MRLAVERLGRVAIALASASAPRRAQRSRPPSSGRAKSTLPAILAIEDDRASTRADLDVLLGAPRGPLADVAIRALGRLERRDVITDLLPLLAANDTRRDSRHGARPGAPRPRPRRRSARPAGAGRSRSRCSPPAILELHAADPIGLDQIARALGRLPYRGRRIVQVGGDVPSPSAREAVSAGPGCAARRRRERPRIAGAAEPQDRDARATRRSTRCRTVARTLDPRRADQSAQCACGAHRGAARRRRHARGRPRARGSRGPAPGGAGAVRLGIGNRRRGTRRLHPQGRCPTRRTWFGSKPCAPGPGAASRSTGASRFSMRSTTRACTSSSARIDALGDVCRDDDAITTQDGVGGADAAAAWTVAARDARVRGAGQTRSRARRDQHAGLRHAPDLAGADVHRAGPRRSSTTSRC